MKVRFTNQPFTAGRTCHGMTLIEFVLVVVVLIILALMLFPSNPLGRGRHRHPLRAKVEIASLVSAIKQYEANHNQLPVSTNVLASTAVDFTLGTFGTISRTTVTNLSGYQANNSEVIAILLARAHFPDGRPSPNVEHSRNPNRLVFLNAKIVADAKSPGVGQDGVYRDPWGNPYIISLDLNGDGRCRDAFYSRAEVSELDLGSVGHFGLTRADSSPTNRHAFQANTMAMVWSFGPDGNGCFQKSKSGR